MICARINFEACWLSESQFFMMSRVKCLFSTSLNAPRLQCAFYTLFHTFCEALLDRSRGTFENDECINASAPWPSRMAHLSQFSPLFFRRASKMTNISMLPPLGLRK